MAEESGMVRSLPSTWRKSNSKSFVNLRFRFWLFQSVEVQQRCVLPEHHGHCHPYLGALKLDNPSPKPNHPLTLVAPPDERGALEFQLPDYVIQWPPAHILAHSH